MKDAPKECVQDMNEGTIFSFYAIASAVKSLFTLEKDKCEQYYQLLSINPFLKVPPTKVNMVYRTCCLGTS